MTLQDIYIQDTITCNADFVVVKLLLLFLQVGRQVLERGKREENKTSFFCPPTKAIGDMFSVRTSFIAMVLFAYII